MGPNMYKGILFLTDSRERSLTQLKALRAEGFEIMECGSFEGLGELIAETRPVLIIVDSDKKTDDMKILSGNTILPHGSLIPLIIMDDEDDRDNSIIDTDSVTMKRGISGKAFLSRIMPYIKIGQRALKYEDLKNEAREKELKARIKELQAQNQHLANINKQLSMENSSKEILPPFLKLSPEVIAISRISDGKVIDVNDAAERVTGYDRKEALETTTLKAKLWVVPEDREKMAAILMKEGRVHNFETRFRKKSGAIFPIMLSACIIVMDSEPCIITTFMDITEKRRTEYLLKARIHITDAASSGDIESVIRTSLNEAEKLTESRISFFHTYEQDKKTAMFHTWSDATVQVCDRGASGRHYLIDDAGAWAECIRQKKPVILNGYMNMPEKKGLPPGHVPILRVMTIPVADGEEISGVIGVGNKAWDYDEGDVKALVDLTSMTYDIIKKITAEMALRESEERFKAIFENAAIGIAQTDMHGNFVNMNIKFAEIIGYSRQELVGTPFMGITHPDDCKDNRKTLEKMVTGDLDSLSFEKRYIHKKGYSVWVNIAVAAIRKQNQPVYFIATIEDITSRKKAESSLQRERDFTSAILDTSGALIIVLDTQGRVVIFNRKCEELTGYAFDEIRGLKFWDVLILPEEKEGVKKVFANLTIGFFPNNYENQWKTKSGEAKLIAWNNTGLVDDNEEVTYIIGTGIDITEKRKTEDALKRSEATLRRLNEELEQRVEERTRELEMARHAAENANKAKSSFLANMSHELRTPLNAILGFSQLMTHDPELPDRQRKNLGTINRSGEHLLQLINNVLDIAKIESGHTSINMTFFDLHRLSEDMIGMFKLPATNKNINLRTFLSHDIPRYVSADEGKLRQILINIMANAVKFTEKGEISFSMSISREPSSERIKNQAGLKSGMSYLIFKVADTGAGMTKDEIEIIFMPFLQTSSGQAKAEGTGLGLSISRQFALLMGGDLYAESMGQGTGSTFTLEIPVDINNLPESSSEDAKNPGHSATDVIGRLPCAEKKKILIAEDVEVNRTLLFELLTHWEFEVNTSANGKEAYEKWKKWQPDLIFMDMRMPVMDGYEAIEKIRAETSIRQPFIIALTASTFEEQKLAILEKGANSFLSKPYREKEIAEQLEKYLGVRFIYDAAFESIYDHDPRTGQTVSAMDLSAMTRDWLAKMAEAVADADATEIQKLADTIKTDYPDIAVWLQSCADDFDYEPIRAALENAKKISE